jgi:hypothetical protein
MKCWSILFSIVMVFTLTWMPYRDIFLDSVQDDQSSFLYMLIEFIFKVDLCLHFFIPYYHDGRLVTQNSRIAIGYIQSWFIVDFIIWYVLVVSLFFISFPYESANSLMTVKK